MASNVILILSDITVCKLYSYEISQSFSSCTATSRVLATMYMFGYQGQQLSTSQLLIMSKKFIDMPILVCITPATPSPHITHCSRIKSVAVGKAFEFFLQLRQIRNI